MMSRYRWIPVYLLTAGLGLGLAYVVSSSLMGRAVSQAPPPSDGSLPPEFLNEIEGGAPAAAPSGGGTTSPAAPTPPPPIENLPSTASQPAAQPVPPPAPPQAEAPSVVPAPQEAPGTANPPGGIDGYVYDPTGRRDPFRPYRMIRSDRTVGPIIEPLQTYDIDQLSIVGILWEVRAPRALVKDSDGNLHTVVKNTKIGRNNGYVAAIREGEVVVVETLEEDGKSYKRTKVLEFKK